MMTARFSHLALNVMDLPRSERFYLDALAPLGVFAADGEQFRYSRLTNGTDFVLVLAQVEDRFLERGHHRKTAGIHHFALAVPARNDLDIMARHLASQGIPLLGAGVFETDYRSGYAGLMFEDPDRITIEISHHHVGYYAA